MSLVARYLEAHGIPTLCVASALDIIEAGNPPRAVFVDYPLGHSAGRPFDSADQLTVMRRAIAAFETISTPGEIIRFDNVWPGDESWRTAAANPSGGDTRQPRDMSPQYQTEQDRLLAEGG